MQLARGAVPGTATLPALRSAPCPCPRLNNRRSSTGHGSIGWIRPRSQGSPREATPATRQETSSAGRAHFRMVRRTRTDSSLVRQRDGPVIWLLAVSRSSLAGRPASAPVERTHGRRCPPGAGPCRRPVCHQQPRPVRRCRETAGRWHRCHVADASLARGHWLVPVAVRPRR